jgi:2,4-dienoyl-CoA reductase-like NADH-dependent reductase (Old Yellow Enzyme family)
MVADAVAFGRYFVANPHLPLRVREDFALTPYDRDTFYTFDSAGYNDYASSTNWRPARIPKEPSNDLPAG